MKTFEITVQTNKRDELIIDLTIDEPVDLLKEDETIEDVTDWGEVPEYFHDTDLNDCDELKEFIDFMQDTYLDESVIIAGLECGIELNNIEEAYQGEYRSDAEFAEETAEQLGYLDNSKGWPHNCIDWDQAANDLMMDYTEHNGHYFRNL